MKSILIFLTIILSLTSCINKLAKVEFNDIYLADSIFEGNNEYYYLGTRISKIYTPKNRTIEFWSVKKMVNPNNVNLGLVCDFFLGDTLFYSLNIDPMQLELDKTGTYSRKNNNLFVTYKGRLNGYFISPYDTHYILKVHLFSTPNNSVQINKLTLSLKLKSK